MSTNKFTKTRNKSKIIHIKTLNNFIVKAKRRGSMKKIFSMLLTTVLVFSLMTSVALASPTEPCDGYKYRPFNGSTACVDDNGNLHICEKNFPDNDFRYYINQAYDRDDDDLLTPTEVADILDIDCSDSYIKDLSGIEFFTAATSLDCSENELTSLDISKNINLEELSCDENMLTSLDVQNNKSLEELSCKANQLTSLEVSKNEKLIDFSCSYNKLTSLNVSKNKDLETLECSGNQLNTLDVTTNTKLTELSCNNNNLAELNVLNNKELESLDCYANKLKALDIKNNTELGELNCEMNQLDVLDISSNRQLESLFCGSNNLKRLDASNNISLAALHCDGNELIELKLSQNNELKYLTCSANSLSTLDVSKNTKLSNLECRDNNITALDVSNNTSLQKLNCCNNQLKSLNLGTIKSLSILDCSYNQLSTLSFVDGQSYPTLTLYRQHKENIEYSIEGNTYIVDLGKIVGSSNLKNIKSVSAKSKSGVSLTASFDAATGKATFTEEPSTVTYLYYVRFHSNEIGNMDVTLHMKKPATTGHTADHKVDTIITRATTSEDGRIASYCTECNKIVSTKVIPRVSSIKLLVSSIAYNGKTKIPAVVIKDRTGKTLLKDIDYTVSYKGFKQSVGISVVTVKFIGNYVGTKTLNHTIKPVATSIGKLTAGSKKFAVKWAKKVTEVTGYQIQYSKNAKFTSVKTVTIGKNSTTGTTISKLTAKTKYYVRIRTYKTVKVNGKAVKIYSDWSKAMTVTTKK